MPAGSPSINLAGHDARAIRRELRADLLDALDPARSMTRAGLPPDPWQRDLLRSTALRLLVLCARQSGKSTTAAALGLHTALFAAPALVLLLSPSLRQSQELFRAAMSIYAALGAPIMSVQESALRLELANGSRIIALPGESDATIRGYAQVRLLVIDEAARVPDDLYRATRPMLAVSGGRLVALSTPYGRQGWFHEEWTQGEGWARTRVTAEHCPRITAAFLKEERQHLGAMAYREEYECEFVETREQFLSDDAINAVFAP
jgi:hypothetical protein